MTNDLSWEFLLGNEPRLKIVLDAAKELRAVRNRKAHFCANSYWLTALPERRSFRQVVEMLLGQDTEAYAVASRKIYALLPDCKSCYCKTIGLIPKSDRLIQIESLFLELKKAADWCNDHPEDQFNYNVLFDEAEPIFDELERLGISRDFSETIFIFGPEITPDLILQFEDQEG